MDTAKIQVKTFIQNTALKKGERTSSKVFFSLNLTSLGLLSLDARERGELLFRFDNPVFGMWLISAKKQS